MIYCVWYPSGGFGHFVNGVLSLYGENFIRPSKSSIDFSANGNSHALDLVAPKYRNCRNKYKFDFAPGVNYSVLIDNGINDESTAFMDDFADACVIKICYDQHTWPVVARAMVEKAMNSTLEQQLPLNLVASDTVPDWATREKYFLFLRDHELAHSWTPSLETENLMIDQLFDYRSLCKKLSSINIQVKDFYTVWKQWYQCNQVYIAPVVKAKSVIQSVNQRQSRTLDDFDTLWAQAVLYYFLFLEFDLEVPHNDYADFFSGTDQIIEWLDL